MNTHFISINPWCFTYTGHNYIYLKSLEQACQILKYDFTALLPRKNVIDSLPNNWLKSLNCPTVRHWYEHIEKKPYKRERKLVRAKQRIAYYQSLYLFLIKRLRAKRNILFYETFAPSDIKILKNLLSFLPKKKLEVWLLYRYPSSFMKQDVIFYKKYHSSIKRAKVPLKLFTDSELLAKDLSLTFKEPFNVLPIPHVEDLKKNKVSKNRFIKCWWPGLPRMGKGQKIIEEMISKADDLNKHLEIMVSQEAKFVSYSRGPKLIQLPGNLPRKNYVDKLNESDFILLPYTDSCYQKTTSGIFLETIICGKIPVVYPGTWMAHELKKYDLEELVINWSLPSIAQKLIDIKNNSEIAQKLKEMQRAYYEFHSIENFSSCLKKWGCRVL